jgi:hypothetical protein
MHPSASSAIVEALITSPELEAAPSDDEARWTSAMQ